ncbi:MAG: 2-oxoacid:acceptor oxidoreductase subunit alpha [Candidatus Bathyarchaeota archaeon]|jgi:2-oxoglutarate ferredoxin oxidoreductase subunit alpha|nr:2-oxoacid:acceptor oxidoreductase subunit alpha [Candidatus Bathyarchaeota archaeon A05DMB-3]MDH7607258.1 2-oxoacid:acceptor oxidoreductase subunit alpha [Candidatus Bathyarchaeota archaeon]
MAKEKTVLTGVHFMSGDIACAEGAIAAGCRFFAGYPITPATEIAEHIAARMPKIGGVYVQMEDEIASIAAVIGASYAGLKAMTATSGPGFSLMQENIGLAAMTEAPCVIVDVMRGGPSTGQPTLPGQQDVMQAKWGSHGDYEIIALAPSSVQEMFDLTIEAFNLAETYRVPTMVMADEVVAHMWEKLVIPPAEEIKIVNRKRPNTPPEQYLPFMPEDDLVPPMACFGEGYRFHATGLTHDEHGYPQTQSSEAQTKLVQRLCDKIRKNADKIVRFEETMVEDAEILVVAYGIVARAALSAVRKARENGIKAGLLRLVTLWPFPEKHIAKAAEGAKAIIVPEMNCGQMVREVERTAKETSVFHLSKLGEEPPTPMEIFEALRRHSK